jgi:hypothetical protein
MPTAMEEMIEDADAEDQPDGRTIPTERLFAIALCKDPFELREGGFISTQRKEQQWSMMW